MKYQKLLLSGFILAGFLLLGITSVQAHERQVFNIGGQDYIIVIGSLNEPITVDDKTGLDLRVKKVDPSDPFNANAAGAIAVEGLETTLKLRISAANKNKEMEIEPAFRDPGAYRAYFYPTVATTISYTLFGQINGIDVELKFTCLATGHTSSEENKDEVSVSEGVTRKFKAGAFSCPEEKSSLGFPEESASVNGLSNEISGLSDMVRQTYGLAIVGIAASILNLAVLTVAVYYLRRDK